MYCVLYQYYGSTYPDVYVNPEGIFSFDTKEEALEIHSRIKSEDCVVWIAKFE